MSTKRTKRDLKNITEVLGQAAGQRAAFVFECMEIAEQEIARVALQRPNDGAVFSALLPPVVLRDKSVVLYRMHAREICERSKAGKKLEGATDAMLLAAFSDTSLKAPLQRNAAAAMSVLFDRCFPGAIPFGAPVDESYPGAALEEIEQARRRLS